MIKRNAIGLKFAARWAAALSLSLCVIPPVLAQTPDQFDKPMSVQTVKPKPDDDAEIRCTYFPDLMIRETQDGPSSENAEIVRDAKAACTASPVAGATVLDTNGMTLEGRRGMFLLFSDLDPHGATGFVIIDARSGKILLRDAALSNPVLQNLALANGTLRLRYKRGINAPCSLMADAQKCWAELVKEKLVPSDLKAPSAQICAEAYKRDKAPRDNPSIVAYATEVAIDAAGGTKVLSRGALECDSLP
ncbi:hypothetical protein [Pseudorhodoplanes sp.]|uniref:hypothetical protein n=1 Tax=Pseudorhodoplanes sp. TaxID=1934341 RepID=UPI002B5CA453|nr:hypothetical protein [Pseudorhodoplanes sp.]HWV54266.1 hypothetical protein [Pseudorhodoplanes sp.]